jgi:hypothetical protein
MRVHPRVQPLERLRAGKSSQNISKNNKHKYYLLRSVLYCVSIRRFTIRIFPRQNLALPLVSPSENLAGLGLFRDLSCLLHQVNNELDTALFLTICAEIQDLQRTV